MAPWEEYQAAAVADPTTTTALKPWEEYAAADTELPEVVATEGGGGFLEKLNALFGSKEGVSERPSQLATDIKEAAPEGTPFVRGFGETASHVVPQSWGEVGGLAESFFPPIEAYRQTRAGIDIASGKPAPEVMPEITELKDLEDIKAQYGGDSPEYQAAAGKAAGNVLSQMIMAGVLGKSLHVPPYVPLRAEPLAPEPPPTQRMGPGTIADDVRRALQEPERRFTLQEPPPEPAPELAPPPPVEDMLANVPKEPPVFNPELGPQTIPEFQMPLRTESAVTPGARPLTPGAAKQLGKLKAYVEKSKKLGQQVDPKVEQKIAEIEGVPQEAPVQAQEGPSFAPEAPGGVPVAETPAGAVEPPPPGAGASFAKATGSKPPLAPVPTDMINAVKLPSGKIVGHNVEHGDVLSRYSEQYEPGEMTSGWVLKRPTRGETDATFIGTDDVQRHSGDFDAAFKEKQPPPPEVPPSERGYAGMEPLPQKPREIGQSIEAKAVEAKLTKGFPETAGYDPITIKDQAARASDLVKQNPSRAGAIIRGEEPLPPEIKGTSLITAMEEHLLRNPSAQGAYELANSRLVSLTSEAAQEMRLMSERVPDGITAKFAEIKAAREKGAELRKETKAKVKKEINGEVVKAASKRPTWEAFVREIVC